MSLLTERIKSGAGELQILLSEYKELVKGNDEDEGSDRSSRIEDNGFTINSNPLFNKNIELRPV